MKNQQLLILTALLAVLGGGLALVSTNDWPASPDANKTKNGDLEAKDSAEGINLAELAFGNMAAFKTSNPPIEVPDLSFKDETGKTLSLADFKGKVVLLNLWATWCAPCLHEMPTLDALQGEMGNDQFEVLALSIDSLGAQTAKKMLEKLKTQHLKLYNDETAKAARNLGVKGMPATILINDAGLEIGRLSGPAVWNSPEAKRLISEVLKHSK